MHPHDYLKLRRRAAGLSIEEAQAHLDRVIHDGVDRRPTGEDYEQLRDPGADMVRLEAGLSIAGTRILGLISVHVYPIDPVIYLHLGMGGTPDICRFCGCSRLDACFVGESCCQRSDKHLCTAPECQMKNMRENRRAA